MNEILPILAQTANNGAGFFFGLGAVGLLVASILFIFWLWMLIDALENASLDPTMRIVWVLLVFLLPFVGALLYLFVGQGPNPQKNGRP